MYYILLTDGLTDLLSARLVPHLFKSFNVCLINDFLLKSTYTKLDSGHTDFLRCKQCMFTGIYGHKFTN